MELYYPTKRPFNPSQGFNQNANPQYAKQGFTGHSGFDIAGAYEEKIWAAVDCYLYSTINMGASPEKYRAIYTIVDEEFFSYEVTYGHVIDCIHELKQFIKAGAIIGRMGNFGDVYSNGKYVTKEEKLAGSRAGTHLHFQVRKCIRVKKKSNGKTYLRDNDGDIKLNGMYYEIVDYENGVNGCIDPAPMFNEKFASEIAPKYVFSRDLTIGSTGADVEALQKLLVARGDMVMPVGVSYGYFGEITRSGVIKYQTDHSIKPNVGYFGPVTRSSINNL